MIQHTRNYVNVLYYADHPMPVNGMRQSARALHNVFGLFVKPRFVQDKDIINMYGDNIASKWFTLFFKN